MFPLGRVIAVGPTNPGADCAESSVYGVPIGSGGVWSRSPCAAGVASQEPRHAEAEPLYKRSLAISEKALGAEHPDVAASLENYSALLRKTGRDAEAARMETRAKKMRTKHPEWTAQPKGFFDRLLGR